MVCVIVMCIIVMCVIMCITQTVSGSSHLVLLLRPVFCFCVCRPTYSGFSMLCVGVSFSLQRCDVARFRYSMGFAKDSTVRSV